MKRTWPVVVGIILLLLAGCENGNNQDGTKAPAASGAATAHGTTLLAELASDPTGHEDQRVLVNGQFAQLPRPICNGALHLSPASWALSEQGVIIQVAGLEDMLFPLAPNNLALTLTGRWTRWQGLIGCGSAAVESTVWYLEAERIVAPNPLSRATLTPMGTGSGQPQGPDTPAEPSAVPEQEQPGAPTQTAVATATVPTSPLATPTATQPMTPAVQPTATTVTPSPSPTAPISPIGTPTPSPTGERLSTMQPPASPTLLPGETATALPTFTPLPDATDMPSPLSSPTPTSTATATPTPSADPLDQGTLLLDFVVNGILGSQEIHRWFYSGSDMITISVAGDPDLDISVTVRNPAGADIERKDSALAGGTEVISNVELPDAGQYQILVSDVSGHAGNYAISITEPGSMPIIFPGNLNYGTRVSVTMPIDSFHIWHFLGNAGDSVTIEVAPNDDTDLIFSFFGPDMDNEIDYIDFAIAGEAEVATFELAESGMYSIWVEEFSGESSSYRVLVTR